MTKTDRRGNNEGSGLALQLLILSVWVCVLISCVSSVCRAEQEIGDKKNTDTKPFTVKIHILFFIFLEIYLERATINFVVISAVVEDRLSA